MAFKTGMDVYPADSGERRGAYAEIACECWFTSTGGMLPLMVKVKDEQGRIHTVKEIAVHFTEEKNYAGVPSIEFDVGLELEGLRKNTKLIYLKEECRWVMKLTDSDTL